MKPTNLKNKLLALSMSLCALGFSSAATAQSFQLKSYYPGIKSTAGFLSASRQNSPDAVANGSFSFPTTQLTIPGAYRGAMQEVQLDVYALGKGVTASNVSTSQNSGISPLVVKSENCTGVTLSEGQFCSVVVAVQNADGRGSNTGQLHINGTDSVGKSISGAARLSWDVVAPISIQSISSLGYGEVEVGAVSSPKFFRVQAFSAPLTISSLSVPAGFELGSVNCLTSAGTLSSIPAVIRPSTSGDYCEFGVTFRPVSAVAYGENLIVGDDDESSEVSVALTGQGTAPKSYAVLLVRGKQSSGFSISTDGLTVTKTGSWNNYARFVGSKLLDSGKYYVEIDNGMGLTSFGMTQGIGVYTTLSTDKGFSAATLGLSNLVGQFGMLIDMDSRTIQAVDANCNLVSSVVALTEPGGYTPYLYDHFNTASGTSQSVNFGQYAMRCSFSGYQNGWFTQQ